MSVTILPAPIHKSVIVQVPTDRAFEIFTTRFGRWWPASYTIGNKPMKNAVIEQRQGGRWFEIGEDGTECLWGEVLEWDPPTRLLLAWRIGADWKHDANLLTEVEVTFHPDGDNRTRVELEHRLLENLGEASAGVRQTFESDHGWVSILASYAAIAN